MKKTVLEKGLDQSQMLPILLIKEFKWARS